MSSQDSRSSGHPYQPAGSSYGYAYPAHARPANTGSDSYDRIHPASTDQQSPVHHFAASPTQYSSHPQLAQPSPQHGYAWHQLTSPGAHHVSPPLGQYDAQSAQYVLARPAPQGSASRPGRLSSPSTSLARALSPAPAQRSADHYAWQAASSAPAAAYADAAEVNAATTERGGARATSRARDPSLAMMQAGSHPQVRPGSRSMLRTPVQPDAPGSSSRRPDHGSPMAPGPITSTLPHYTQLADQYQALLDSARTLGSRGGATPHHDLQTLQQMLGTAGTGADLLNNVIMHGGSAGTRHTGNAAHPKQARPEVVQEVPACLGCGATSTPEWRRGPLGPRTLCNACGLVFAKMKKKEAKAAARRSGAPDSDGE